MGRVEGSDYWELGIDSGYQGIRTSGTRKSGDQEIGDEGHGAGCRGSEYVGGLRLAKRQAL